MKRSYMSLIFGVLFLLSPCFAWAQCPEDPNDSGICDTMYLEVLPPDIVIFPGTVHHPRVCIFVTHDTPDPSIDSIAAFVIPLHFEHTNLASGCILDPALNNTCIYPGPTTDRSIFRHMGYDSHTIINWMMALSEQLLGLGWDTRILDLADQLFWMALFPTGSADQLFPQGSKTLLATMTFTLEDSTTICIDTCFWPPASRLTFILSDGVEYIPRHNLPYCFSISYLIGDCNSDGTVDAADIVYLINYLFCGGTAPPLVSGDVNCDGAINGADVVFLINYLFRGGPEPSC